ncbi:MAG: nicotinate (nicotinamide) nucleotide adenylyltransferase [Deltaproteobacteria bacterium]|jgi:nicotinate-nucleotide adenylyltransferase|nr:nicotinate (nicotinamide) nucleotide adenylyltransferase [Deltaproteobacteria bacterium]
MVQAAERKQQIGLLGGTFDPVHNGHLAVAGYVLQALGLDAVWFIPAALPPHKDGHADGRDISAFAHRLAMLQAAVAEIKSFVVSDIEAKRSTPSYSIDTIEIMLPQVGDQADLLFIIGADAFLEIDTWKRYRELPTLVSFVIISRPNYSPEAIGKIISENFTGYQYDHSSETWSSPNSNGSFILQHMEPVLISSTDIRERVRKGKDINGLVPPAVADYIRTHGLYK